MERLPDAVQHAEHRQWHLDRDRSRAGGWLERFRLACFAMGALLPLMAPLSCDRRGEESPPASFQFNGLRAIPRLRAPLTSIIDSTTTPLQACPGLDPAAMLELSRIIDEQANHMRGLLADLLDQGASRRAIEETAVVGHGRPASLSSVVNARPAAVARAVAGLGGAPAPSATGRRCRTTTPTARRRAGRSRPASERAPARGRAARGVGSARRASPS